MKKFLIVCLVLLVGLTCVFADANTAWRKSDSGYWHITDDVNFMSKEGKSTYFGDNEDGAVMLLFNADSKSVAYAVAPIVKLNGKVKTVLICNDMTVDKPETLEVQLSKSAIDSGTGNYCYAFFEDYKLFKYFVDNYNSFDTIFYYDNGDMLAIRCNVKILSLYL